MRKTALVVTFLFVAACMCVAGDEAQAANKAAASPSSSTTPAAEDQLGPNPSKPEAGSRAALPLLPPGYKLSKPFPTERVCLKMRSYIVARESPDSDSTRLVGYKTCQPSWKYELRTTVGTVKDSSR
jgi:hypothetical protein